MKRPLPAVVVFILGVALAAGCGDHSGRREGGSAIAPPSPSHPAMAPSTAPGGKSAGSAPAEGTLPEGRPAVGGAETGGLPPGHPPLGGESSPPPRDGGAQSGASSEGPEVRIGPLTLTAPEGWVRRAPSSG